eukprot:CAMPEP_0117475660 /NCGR_PEP_ID=MMETSP0784-20121206/9909_1 /TAXON_ID=39447 /ORGANISM="" /LENGTH=214 /DNA_ID=CAMNT_0005269913 /DNA_START=46 /DNA_END=690 /DNA_ORIENTATION=+
MCTREDLQKLVRWSRQGKLEGDEGVRTKVNELLKNGFTAEDLDYNEKPYFRSALWEATWKGTKEHETIVKLLVDKGATVAFADYQLRTPLHEAAYYGHMSLVTFFLEKGHPIDPEDKFKQTPLYRAVEAGRDEVVEYLIKNKAQTNLLDKDGVTVQHVASFEGMPTLSNWLMYQGAWKNRFYIEDAGPVLAEDAGEAEGEKPADDTPAAPEEGA